MLYWGLGGVGEEGDFCEMFKGEGDKGEYA